MSPLATATVDKTPLCKVWKSADARSYSVYTLTMWYWILLNFKRPWVLNSQSMPPCMSRSATAAVVASSWPSHHSIVVRLDADSGPQPDPQSNTSVHRSTVTKFRSVSMPAGFRRHLVGKTPRNDCHYDIAKIRFVGKLMTVRTV